MLLKPKRNILKALKSYDKKLSLVWNNRAAHWEVWYKAPLGKKLVTPVVESIYNVEKGSASKFCPLDYRIIDWLSGADTLKAKRNYKWLGRKKFDNLEEARWLKLRNRYINASKDNYGSFNRAFLNPLVEKANWNAPDVQGVSRSRMHYRSAENVREHFDNFGND